MRGSGPQQIPGRRDLPPHDPLSPRVPDVRDAAQGGEGAGLAAAAVGRAGGGPPSLLLPPGEGKGSGRGPRVGRGLQRAGARPRDPRWLTQAWDLSRIFHDLGFPANQGQEWAPRAHVERHQVLTLVNCILPSASAVIDWTWAKESMSSTGLNFPYLYNQSDLRPITERGGTYPHCGVFPSVR